MESYNVDMTGGPVIHYLIADATGKAVLVEFYEGEMVLIPNETRWHLATNFLRAATDSAMGQCRRYDAIHEKLSETQGDIVTQDALDLLQAVSQGSTQWSVVYGITSGDIDVVMGRAYEQVYTFNLSRTAE
jgi:choloylglycine hydrolase